MAQTKTTESVDSKSKIGFLGFEVFDLFFCLVYIGLAYAFSSVVHPDLRTAFMLFSAFMALFLTVKSTANKKRRNFESLYFLIAKDISVYRPYIGDSDEKEQRE